MGLTPLQRLAHQLRKIHLLQAADVFWFARMYLKSRASNGTFMRQHPHMPVPPKLMLYDIQGNCDLGGFYYSGKESALEIARLIRDQHPAAGEPLRVLEWGCGPARVLQHLHSLSGAEWELYGSDYNPETIDWCRRHFPGITFLNNGLHPPLGLESGSVDVFYCISVFTHLSEASHQLWISEIDRVLKPGGLFIGTFHGAAFRDQLTLDEQQVFDSGKLVIRDKITEGKKNFSAYHSDSAVRWLFGRFDCVTKQAVGECFRQTLWTAKKAS